MERTVARTSNDTLPKQAESSIKKVNKPKTLVHEGGENN